MTLDAQRTFSTGRQVSIGAPVKGRGPAEGAPGPAPAVALTDVLPGRYRLVVSFSGNGADYVASAKLGELEVLHSEFPVAASTGAELHVTIRGDGASLEGRVTLQGQSAAGARVYLLPAAAGGGGLITGYCDGGGAYRIEGVPPGDYRIQGWSGSPTAEEILSTSGEQLKLYPGEHLMVVLEASGGHQSSPGQGPPL